MNLLGDHFFVAQSLPAALWSFGIPNVLHLSNTVTIQDLEVCLSISSSAQATEAQPHPAAARSAAEVQK